MAIDISKLKDFNASLFHEIIRYKDYVILIGSNSRFEQCMHILGLEKIIRHEKDPEVIKAILTEA